MGQIANCQSLVFSERSQLSQAIPQVHVEWIWESAKVSHKRVFALLTPEIRGRRNGSNASKTSVRAPGLSTDEREHPFVWYFGAGWEYYTNRRQSRDSNRSATNAESTRTKFCVFRGRYDRQRTLVIRIAAITLASDSAITLARFRPSKLQSLAVKNIVFWENFGRWKTFRKVPVTYF